MRLKGYKLSNGKTFEEEMLKYLSKDTLDLIIQKYPTLTVFVPRLPEDTFRQSSGIQKMMYLLLLLHQIRQMMFSHMIKMEMNL